VVDVIKFQPKAPTTSTSLTNDVRPTAAGEAALPTAQLYNNAVEVGRRPRLRAPLPRNPAAPPRKAFALADELSGETKSACQLPQRRVSAATLRHAVAQPMPRVTRRTSKPLACRPPSRCCAIRTGFVALAHGVVVQEARHIVLLDLGEPRDRGLADRDEACLRLDQLQNDRRCSYWRTA